MLQKASFLFIPLHFRTYATGYNVSEMKVLFTDRSGKLSSFTENTDATTSFFSLEQQKFLSKFLLQCHI